MNLRTTFSGRRLRGSHARRRPALPSRRPALFLGVAAAGALAVNVLVGADPAAQADSGTPQSVSVAHQLGLTARSAPATSDLRPLEELSASRSTRDQQQAAAQQQQQAAVQAELDRQKAEAEAAAQAAAAQAAAQQAAAQQAAAAAAPSGSFQDYALKKLGGDQSQFSCLESLWGKESGWNPNAQNPSSTAYGIPQLLNSTWASTGIAKTSDGYRQIDAGLIYIDNRYGSPCGAWSHSKSTGWY
ncbi:transglycosylase SLT domain-containing protein [Petropleomorpha daqingensis]|uniref:Transglycosylase SLT domain-containing protein n=1 Tax=Petropleomorpha daqingensis TaxID=2026353 RepID=A0A853CS78_9ACTN|nr:transglycosylase SLT domain-containing protein [Petropleomorpha daqingensis]NYJ08743.1 hypothetical protein [Petropleomorpha daqingensis]